MEFLGIGLPELVIIFVILLLVMGPEDLQKTARTLGRWVHRARSSEVWRSLNALRREMQGQFTYWMQEIGMEDRRSGLPDTFYRREDVEALQQQFEGTSTTEVDPKEAPETPSVSSPRPPAESASPTTPNQPEEQTEP